MKRVLFVAVIALLGAVVFIGAGASQEKKVKGRLPNGWKDLGLSEAQKEKVYIIMATYKDKLEMLEKQLEDVRAQQSAEMVGVLTDAQKDKLRKLLLGGLGKELDTKKSDN